MLRALPLLGLILGAVAHAAEERVQATLTLMNPTAVEVAYALPPGCNALRFVNAGISPQAAAAMRADWQVEDGCGKVDAQGIQRTSASCSQVRIRVPATTRKVDRVYGWAFPIDGGILGHTSAYAVKPTCGPVSWRFVAPAGEVVVDGLAGVDAQSAPAPLADYLPVVLLKSPGNSPGLRLDSGFAPDAAAMVAATVDSVTRLYSRAFPALALRRPFTLASVIENGWCGGDVAHRTTMHLRLPASVSAMNECDMRGIVAHEMAHLLQPAESKEVWKAENALIHEGGAELLRTLAASQLGWADSATLAAHSAAAVNQCLLAAAGRNWAGVEERHAGRMPYTCGLALHLLALDAGTSGKSMVTVLQGYFERAGTGIDTNFATALECADAHGCRAQWTERLLSGTEAVADVFAAYAATGRLFRPVATPDAQMIEAQGRQAFAQLMQIDCAGEVSMFNDPGQIRIGPNRQCRTLREGMAIVNINGRPLLQDPGIGPDMATVCQHGGVLNAGLRDGKTLLLGCDARVSRPPPYIAIDPDRFGHMLGQAPAG